MIAEGASATQSLTVTREHTAAAGGHDGVDVLSTPQLLLLLENTCVLAVRDRLEPGQVTLGTRAEFSHLAPTPVGATVRASATLVRVDGRMLHFEICAQDGIDEVARGGHVRAVVDQTRFRQRCRQKAAALGVGVPEGTS